MKRHEAIIQVAITALLSAAVGCLLGCNDSTKTTKSLAVDDYLNSRILIYGAPFSTNESASVVIGQADFTHGSVNQGAGPAANTLNWPVGLARDSAGNLYVPDYYNCRVLQYQSPFTNGMSASVVIGQPDFTSASCLTGALATASGLSDPNSMAVDGLGNLWVSDRKNSRVLEYVPPFSNGMAAALAIGQTTTGATNPITCNQGAAAPTAATLCYPAGAAFDSTGNLWVSDCTNNRLLEFVPPFSTGMAASLELGQPAASAFTSGASNNGGISANSLSCPYASAFFDSGGNLWLADSSNGRVLEYVPPFSNGMAATMVLGQADFTHGAKNQGGSAAANGMSFPTGLAFEDGNFVVEDTGNNRVLIFAPPFSNGMNATTVLGQTSLTLGAANQGNSNPAANTLWGPLGVVTF